MLIKVTSDAWQYQILRCQSQDPKLSHQTEKMGQDLKIKFHGEKQFHREKFIFQKAADKNNKRGREII